MENQSKEVVVEFRTLSRAALVIFILVHIIYLGTYMLIWGYHGMWKELLDFAGWFLWAFIPSILLHEGLHGLIWAIPFNWKHIRFGFSVKLMAPYTNCTVPLKKWHYFAGGMGPAVLMGILPAFYALFTGKVQVLFWGILYTWTAAGDFISCWYVMKENKSAYILDHPEELGYYVHQVSKPEKA
jgi:hypothetical protein